MQMEERETLKNVVLELESAFSSFEDEVEKTLKGNKSAAIRSRKISLGIEKLLKQYRKESIEAFYRSI